MTCQQCREQLSDYLEGDLPAELQAQVAAHLDGCAECARVFEELRTVVAAVRSLPEVEPPPGLQERLQAALRAGSAQPRARRFELRLRYLSSALAAAAVLLLMVWAGTAHLQQQMTSRELPPPTLRAESVGGEGNGAPTPPAAEVGGGAGEVTGPAPAEASQAGQAVTAGPSPGPAPSTAQTPGREPEGSSVRAAGPTREQPPGRTQRRVERHPRRAAPPPAPAGGGQQPASATADETPATIGRALEGEVPGADYVKGLSAATRGWPGPTEQTAPLPMMARSVPLEGETQRIAPKYWAAHHAWAAIADPAGDTPFTVAVYPPGRRVVGEVVPARIVVESERTVERARIQVSGPPTLELVDVPEDGVIYRGPLIGNQRTEQTVRMRATTPGPQSITVNLRSSHPEVETDLQVDLGEFHTVVPATEKSVYVRLVETPVRSAIEQIAQESGMQVQIRGELPDQRVTIDCSGGVPAAAALAIVVEDIGWQVRSEGQVQVVEPR